MKKRSIEVPVNLSPEQLAKAVACMISVCQRFCNYGILGCMPRFCQNPQCGKPIDDMYPSAKTCSAKCRWWAWTHRRKTVGLAHLVDDTLLSQVESLRQAIKRQDGRIAVLEKFMRG